MIDQVELMDETTLFSTAPAARPPLLPFIADHHLPYLMPAIVFWVISKPDSRKSLVYGADCLSTGLTFHYIDTHGLLSKYKLHTPAEDLAKNRASKRDVIKFALIQQAAQCTLGYLTADSNEIYVPPESGVASWARRIHFVGTLVHQLLRSITIYFPWKNGNSKALNNPADDLGTLQLGIPPTAASFSALESVMAQTTYWALIPLSQYVAAMVLADTMQYFTHRAFHVNKWLYSMPQEHCTLYGH